MMRSEPGKKENVTAIRFCFAPMDAAYLMYAERESRNHVSISRPCSFLCISEVMLAIVPTYAADVFVVD